MRESKSIGIIGGMGPLASCDLYRKIILNTKATCDNDHVRVFIDSNPQIPDRTKAILYGGESPLDMLIESARKLQSVGANIITIACNTSHYYIEEIRSSVNVKVLSIIEETLAVVKELGIKNATLFATTGTIKSRLYQNVFEKNDIDIIIPDEMDQEIVMDVIYKGIKDQNNQFNIFKFENLVHKMEEKGAEAIILGCTELPIAIEFYHLNGNFIDPSLILAQAAIKEAGAEVI